MKTRIFTLLMAFLTMVGNAVWGQETVSISSETELREFAEKVNSNTDKNVSWNVTLGGNIDLAGSEENEWTPIGTDKNPFRGTFDGGGFTISGLYIDNGAEDDIYYNGLFGYTASAEIKNLTVEGEITAVGFVGGICGYADGGNYGLIENCHSNVSITVNEYKASDYTNPGGSQSQYIGAVGGICGYAYASLSKCSNHGDITIGISNISVTSGFTDLPIGGLCGVKAQTIPKIISVNDCYNAGDITVKGSDNTCTFQIGGILGVATSVALENCYNVGSIQTSELNISNGTIEGLTLTNSVEVGGIVGIQYGHSETWKALLKYCYNTGILTTSSGQNCGAICGNNNLEIIIGGSSIATQNAGTIENAYYSQSTLSAIGKNGDGATTNVESKDNSAFESGEVAWLLRDAGFGQNLQDDNITSPTLLAFTPNVTVYKLTLEQDSKQTEQYANSGYLNLPELEENAGWYDNDGNLYTSESAISEDITLYAQKKTAHTITIVDTEGGTVASDKTTAIVGETITLTVTTDEGYTFGGLSVMGTEAIETTLTSENAYTFTMPDADVTVTAQFTKNEEPTDPDEGDDEQGGIVPDAPKYYNIYEDEICEGVTVEFSRDVVKEGQSVLVKITVDEEFDASDLALKFKRSLFGYWEDLTLTPTENPNEYIIENIYTDIYVRAEGAVPTGIEEVESAKVYTKDGSIYVYTPTEEQVTIISISGAVLKNDQQIGLRQYTGLQRGIYIICIDEARFKVRL